MSNIDALLVTYLDALTHYQACLDALNSSFSKSFLLLAAARFHAARIGPDTFDGRMRARRGVGWADDAAGPDPARWSGVLVNPRVRETQTAFAGALESALEVRGAKERVRALESEVQRAKDVRWVYCVGGQTLLKTRLEERVRRGGSVRVVKVPVENVSWVWEGEEAVPLVAEGGESESEEREFVDGVGEWTWVE